MGRRKKGHENDRVTRLEKRKVITFDLNDPYQKEIFQFLDKARYDQTKLIIKLLSDFFQKYGITAKTPYDKVKAIIHLYLIDDDQKGLNNLALSESSSQNNINNALLSLLALQLQQQNSARQENVLQHEIEPSVKTTVNTEHITLVQTNETLINEPKAITPGTEPIEEKEEETTKSYFQSEEDEYDEDDDDETNDLKMVANSFKASLN